MLKRPFSLGDKTLSSNIFCAPLAGCSDLPFRRMTASFAPGIVYCEMVKMEALLRRIPQTMAMLAYDEGMHPIGAQLCGSKPELAAQAAGRLEEMGFDAIDLNCGCPVDKVIKDGSGSGLLKHPDLIGEILMKMVSAVSIPVTVKVRSGWDDASVHIEELTQIAEQAGARILTIHGRTRAQGYCGQVNYEVIKRGVDAAKEIQVFGNGDIVDAESAVRMFEQTGCDGILLARGTFGRPWLIEEIYRHFEGKEPICIDGSYLKRIFMTHYAHIKETKNEIKALMDLRRVGCWYLKGRPGGKALRMQLMQAPSLTAVDHLLHTFDWDALAVRDGRDRG